MVSNVTTPSPGHTLPYAHPGTHGRASSYRRAAVLLLAIALPTLTLVWHLRAQHTRQRTAARVVAALGGQSRVQTDSTWHKLTPPRLRRYFDRLRAVTLAPHPPLDAGSLAALAQARSIRDLDCSLVPLSDADLATLTPLADLRTLSLEATVLTDAAAPTLARFRKLERLDLRDTNLSDQSVPTLATLTTLRDLRIAGTAITPAGERHLRAALPTCTIDGVTPPTSR
jgi:hypothetical protein